MSDTNALSPPLLAIACFVLGLVFSATGLARADEVAAAPCNTVVELQDFVNGGGKLQQIAGPPPTTAPGSCVNDIKSEATAFISFVVDTAGVPAGAVLESATNECWGHRTFTWINGTWTKLARFSPPMLNGAPVCVRDHIAIKIELQ